MTKLTPLATALVVATSVVLAAQRPLQPAGTSGSGVIAGQVVDGVTGLPIKDAVVDLDGASWSRVREFGIGYLTAEVRESGIGYLTTEDGRFEVRGLSSGQYEIRATHLSGAGFYGQTEPTGASAPVTLASGQRVTDLRVPLWRFGEISGTVRDEEGQPMPHVLVLAPTYARARGLETGRVSQDRKTLTDDRGHFSIPNMAPDRYVVIVPDAFGLEPPGHLEFPRHDVSNQPAVSEGLAPIRASETAGRRAYVTTFSPSSRSVDTAGVIALAAGEQRASVDIVVQTSRSADVSGAVMSPLTDREIFRVSLVSDPDLWRLGVGQILAHTESEFAFENVPVGHYRLRVERLVSRGIGDPGTPTGPSADVPVDLTTAGIADLEVRLSPSVRVQRRPPGPDRTLRTQPDTVVSGRVLDDRGLPVPRVRITLRGANSDWRAVSDESGTFRVSGPAPGRLELVAEKPGFVVAGAAPSDRTHVAESFELGPGDFRHIDVRLERTAVLAGTVHFPDGSAAPGMAVRAERWPPKPAREFELSAWVVTNARGEFRFGNLVAGDYGISARTDGERRLLYRPQADGSIQRFRYAPIYFGDKFTLEEGTVVRVEPGGERRDSDMVIRPVALSTLQATVQPPPGIDLKDIQVHLVRSNGFSDGLDTPVLQQGRFVTQAVPPGRYSVVAIYRPDDRGPAVPTSRRYCGRAGVDVGEGEPENVTIAMTPTIRVTGRLVVDAMRTNSKPFYPVAKLAPIETSCPSWWDSIAAEGDGAITIDGLSAGRYILLPYLPRLGPDDWSVVTATMNGRDILEREIELAGHDISDLVVTISNRAFPSVRGRVTDASGQPAANRNVVMFPAEPELRMLERSRIHRTSSDTRGRFSFAEIFPGEYLVTGTDVPSHAPLTADILARLAESATRVVLSLDDVKVITVH